jgi:hypothetical protein
MKAPQFAKAAALSGLLAFMLVPAPSLIAAQKNKPKPEITIPLEGFVRFHVYAKKELRTVVDPSDMYTLCTAELVIGDKQNVVLHTRESFDNGDGTQTMFREIYLKGTFTPGGRLKLRWPDTWMELNWETMKLEPTPYPNVVAQIEDHTGYVLSGPGVNKGNVVFKGSFNGQELFADMNVYGFQERPGSMGPPYDVVVDGPIVFSIWFDLQVSQ